MRYNTKILPWFEKDENGRRRMVVPRRFYDLMNQAEMVMLVAIEVMGFVAAVVAFCALVKLCLGVLLS